MVFRSIKSKKRLGTSKKKVAKKFRDGEKKDLEKFLGMSKKKVVKKFWGKSPKK